MKMVYRNVWILECSCLRFPAIRAVSGNYLVILVRHLGVNRKAESFHDLTAYGPRSYHLDMVDDGAFQDIMMGFLQNVVIQKRIYIATRRYIGKARHHHGKGTHGWNLMYSSLRVDLKG